MTLHGGWNRAGVYPQHVVGGFAGEDLYPIPYASHYESHGLALGDVSGDGRPDVVLADYNHGLVVLYSAPAEPPPPPPPPPAADVAVDVTASGSRARPRKSFWFDVKVTNSGPDPTAAALSVQLSGGATNLAENSPACTVQAQAISCSFATLVSGASTTVRVSGIAPKSGTVRAVASVDGAVDDPNAANDTDSASILVR